MSEENREEGRTAEETQESPPAPNNQGKSWYPYITKVQFEKFLSRLEGKVPDQIDRDYIRAIIRTPSMIYRFLRGIEAMKLIDREQQPTQRLHRLVAQESRKPTIVEILRDLYPELLEKWQQANGSMSDRDIVTFFRKSSGMGNDSANKMKMFFKFLVNETDLNIDVESSEPETEKKAETTSPGTSPPSRQSRQPNYEKTKQPPPNQTSPSAPQPNAQAQATGQHTKSLSEMQQAYVQTIQAVLKINIDGDWDDDMIKVAFDRLERLLDRVKRI